jgi:hypothetical protein
MLKESSVRWTDMVDPVYTLALLAGIDPEHNSITGINIQNNRLIVYYNEPNGNSNFISKEYRIDV